MAWVSLAGGRRGTGGPRRVRRPFWSTRTRVRKIGAAGALLSFLSFPGPVVSQAGGPDPRLLDALDWYTGVAGQVDDDRARSLLQAAAREGDSLAVFWVARCLSRGRMGYERNEARARQVAAPVFERVRVLAQAEVLEAVFLMGTAYDEGLGVEEDAAAAIVWYRRAAERGHVLGQHNLGNALAAGRGVARSDSLAAVWWRRAAEAGDAVTQLRLGEAYEWGRGVPTDLEEARRWYGEAASRGNEAAAEALARLGGTIRDPREDGPAGP